MRCSFQLPAYFGNKAFIWILIATGIGLQEVLLRWMLRLRYQCVTWLARWPTRSKRPES